MKNKVFGIVALSFAVVLSIILPIIFELNGILVFTNAKYIEEGVEPIVLMGDLILYIISKVLVSIALLVVGGSIISVVQTLGYIIAIVMVLYVGIQWLIGTPAKKQELKGKMVNVVIGAILIIAGVTILGLVGKFTDESKNSILSEVEISETYMA